MSPCEEVASQGLLAWQGRAGLVRTGGVMAVTTARLSEVKQIKWN
jgi:hypothetical protein